MEIMELPSEKGKFVKLDIQIFLRSDGQIGISHNNSKETEFITTVNDKEGSKRGHKNLFNHLRNILEKHEKWDTTE